MVQKNNENIWEKTIGIVGGLGPYAHIELERQILKATEQWIQQHWKRPAQDQDYPPWIVSSIPDTPDRTKAIGGEAECPLPWLVRGVKQLYTQSEAPRADFAVIACNTAHAFFEKLCDQVEISILNIVEETIKAATEILGKEGTKIGVLATTGTIKTELYQQAAQRRRLKIISPLDLKDGAALQEDLVMKSIYEIKSGEINEQQRERLLNAARKLIAEGAELIITGCTEIPLALRDESTNKLPLVNGISFIDPMEISAKAAVAIALGERPLPKH